MTNINTALKPETVKKDQAEIDALHKDYLASLDAGNIDKAMEDVAKAKAIIKRDPKAHP